MLVTLNKYADALYNDALDAISKGDTQRLLSDRERAYRLFEILEKHYPEVCSLPISKFNVEDPLHRVCITLCTSVLFGYDDQVNMPLRGKMRREIMYRLTVKTAEDRIVVLGDKMCVYDHKSFDDLMSHVEQFRTLGVMRDYGWKLEISQ